MEWLIFSVLLWQMGKEDIDLNLVIEIIFSFSKWKTEAINAHVEVRGLPCEALGLWDEPYFSECTLHVPQGLCGSLEKSSSIALQLE